VGKSKEGGERGGGTKWFNLTTSKWSNGKGVSGEQSYGHTKVENPGKNGDGNLRTIARARLGTTRKGNQCRPIFRVENHVLVHN